MPQKKKTYLVTGAAGFIGSRFVESCNLRGIQLISIDQPAFFHERKEHAHLNFGTLLDMNLFADSSAEKVQAEIARHLPGKPDGIVHLGAITDTREADPEKLKKFNLGYSQTLCKYAAAERIPFVYASSAATYGEGEQGYEDDETKMSGLVPLNLYGKSKLDFDLWLLQKEKDRQPTPPRWAGFKFFNVYGFGERHKGFMASVVLHSYDQIMAKGEVTLFKSHRPGIADGQQKRDFVFVEDVVNVLHFALESPIKRGVFNLGSGQARSFLDLAKAVFKALGREELIHFVDTPISIRDKYQYFTQAPMKKLRDAGYSEPFTSLEEGVLRYVNRLKAK